MPFYRPQQLGAEPVNITVTRRPYPEIQVLWQAEHFLSLKERKGGPMPTVTPQAQPLPGHPGSMSWQDGRTQLVVIPLDDLWIELRTDLSLRDVQRLVDTLRPNEKLL